MNLHAHRAIDPATLGALVLQADHWRRSPASVGGPAGHKEWSHFCIFGRDLDLLINFSLMDAFGAIETPRLTVLMREPGGDWTGDVDAYASSALEIDEGGVDLRLGPNRLRFRDGAYELDLALRRQALRARLRLELASRPALTTSVPLADGPGMRWFVVPRLEASGTVVWRGGRRELVRAPAYHDHDWGSFRWGGDFSWEWGIGLADGAVPWTLVFQRISDRGRLRTLSQGVLLWRGDRHLRTLHGSELSVHSEGRTSTRGALRVPRIMSLVSPGRAADLPARIRVEARRGADALDIEFELGDLAQVAIPNDVGRGATIVSEVRSEVRVEGQVRGEPVCFEGPGLVEMNRAAA
jgi:hypothetical protein